MLLNSAAHAAVTAEIMAGDVDDRCSKGAPRFVRSQGAPSQFSVPGRRFKTPRGTHGRRTKRLLRLLPEPTRALAEDRHPRRAVIGRRLSNWTSQLNVVPNDDQAF